MSSHGAVDATAQDGTYPRPQLVRPQWHDLSGEWDFARDDGMAGQVDDIVFDRRIVVPFPPESPASGIGETGFTPCVWYRRSFGRAELADAGFGAESPRVLLHLGAVDHAAEVWVNGRLVATHSGGQSPFHADITRAVDPQGDNALIVRAIDLPEDVSVLRGKQDWRERPHSIWYHRTTGIWQPVWLECVPEAAVETLTWRTDLPTATVDVDVALSGAIPRDAWVRVSISHDGERLADVRVRTGGRRHCPVRLVIPRQLNGQQYEELLWSPARPTLLSAAVTLESESGTAIDTVASYVGLRSVSVSAASLLLNDRPIPVRAVLAQNYWPDTHLAATADTLRREVELILELGFNTARVHQKAEDPRFLFWADRLGLMVWAETANAYAFDERAIVSLVDEWTALVRRDQSHPSVVVWVPLNESWGVQHISHDARQAAFSRSIGDLTRALDGTRPVISNDGWEHTDSDIITIHDYEPDAHSLTERYGDPARLREMLDGFGPAGRRMTVGPHDGAAPVILSEFGGVSLETGGADDWGYSSASDPAAFERQVTAILRAVRESSPLAGFCYTQLTDTGQETNGLLFDDRSPKFPVERIRAAVTG
ncbi:glycoside hydrolase family 2 [Microbacterium yannicii]|uniref:Glycoside hydrolase family 2 n=1 Tax=Microbacterium yannicii TaxID=671622 RepID=A0ABP9M0D0_9MICO|nr:glycoside hydrolase family 2 TIM barrel-domain containing protein [Microbacterium yannicii]MCO5954673.1 glycoside hydrolase family 2 [Microbacterium yannicii]